MLDRQLKAHGQTIKLRKTNTAAGQIEVLGFVRGYKPDEVVGIISAGDTKIVCSPKGLDPASLPATNGFAVVQGTPRRIISATPFYIGGELVRMELQVCG